MDVTTLLSRLEGVKSSGQGSWVCRCPAHEDRSPSMTVKELPDGRILIHDFAGCGTDEILGVLGLAMQDLFPAPLGMHMRPVRAFSAADALRCLTRESTVVVLAAADQAEGKPVDEIRVAAAAGRIATALEFTCGS